MNAVITPTVLTYDQFVAQFKPIINTIQNGEGAIAGAYDSMMFETFGSDLLHVRQTETNRIWTLVEADSDVDDEDKLGEPMDTTLILSGYHHVNRLGYFISSVPVEPEEVYEVQVGLD